MGIQADDRKLYWEGVSSLVHDDLVEANDMRGLPHHGITDDQMAKQLNRWLLLSMNSAASSATDSVSFIRNHRGRVKVPGWLSNCCCNKSNSQERQGRNSGRINGRGAREAGDEQAN